jgi:hypothetical protein
MSNFKIANRSWLCGFCRWLGYLQPITPLLVLISMLRVAELRTGRRYLEIDSILKSVLLQECGTKKGLYVTADTADIHDYKIIITVPTQ